MKQIFLLIIAITVLTFSAFAQTPSCNLQLDVYKFQVDPDPEPVEIKKVTTLLQTGKSKTGIKANPQTETPLYEELPAGNYKAVISMKDYKVTTKEIDFNCSRANEQNVVTEVIFLWEGDAKETMKMNGGAFSAIGSDSDQLKTASVKTADDTDKPLQLKAVEANNQLKTVSVDSPNMPQEVFTFRPEGKQAINSRASYLPKPDYPRAAAAAVKASGAVQVEVLIDEIGRVVQAKAIGGHPLLRAASVKAARGAKFGQTRLQGMPVQVAGIVVYNFVP